MARIRAEMAKIRAILKLKSNKILKIRTDNVADLLTISAFFIIFYTTFELNTYIGMYILAAELLIISYFVAK